ncbi:MAG: HDIG domain-containing protein [Bacteroidetes bacterium]|nr:HDIG domain-containing protein [Bacteroidota bacterium]
MNTILSKLQHNYYDILKVLLFILAIALVVWISPRESMFKYEFNIGKPWNHNDLIAPYDFSIYKTDKQIAEEKEQVLKNFRPYFRYDEDVTESGRYMLIENFGELWQVSDASQRSEDSVRLLKVLKKIYDDIQKKGVIQYHEILEGKGPEYPIRIIRGNELSNANLGSFYDVNTANEYANEKITKLKDQDSSLLKLIISQSLVQNVFYDQQKSVAESTELLNRISSTHGLVQKGELIISTGELVNPDKYQVLMSLKRDYEQDLGGAESQYFIITGNALLIILLFLIEFLFIFLYYKNIFDSLKFIVLILISQLVLIVITHYIFRSFPQWTYMIPFAILPILIAVFVNRRIAIIVHLVTVLILGFYAPNSFNFFYTQFTSGLIAVFTVGDLSKRADLFKTSLFIFLTYIVVYLSMLFVQEGSLDSFSYLTILYLAGSSILVLLAFPLIFLYEKLFRIVTHLTLLELSNTNNTLLRELSEKAPGTFQHSLQVANLASEALYVIGGDALMARTGALYHDIGKMYNPMYFVENQTSGYNPHDELSYEDSARIIIGHVLDGIEMARKAGLPEQIIDFIRTHHGTRRVEYFYRLEKKMKQGMEVDETEFRYHGPIPFSRETAVVMMADSIEAASRSINKPDEQKINDLVENIVSSLMDGNQFINSNMTLREINTVKKVLKKKIMNINHVRIAYPD